VLQWARSQPEPCPWDRYVVEAAAALGHFHVIAWLESLEDPDLSYAFDDMEIGSYDEYDEEDEEDYDDSDYYDDG
jgi:hypothetical protein